MLVFRPGDRLSASKLAPQGARIMVLGGATMEGPRHHLVELCRLQSKERIDGALRKLGVPAIGMSWPLSTAPRR